MMVIRECPSKWQSFAQPHHRNNVSTFTMFIFRVLFLLGSLQCLLVASSGTAQNLPLPVVDLGYELHQATFNVSDCVLCYLLPKSKERQSPQQLTSH